SNWPRKKARANSGSTSGRVTASASRWRRLASAAASAYKTKVRPTTANNAKKDNTTNKITPRRGCGAHRRIGRNKGHPPLGKKNLAGDTFRRGAFPARRTLTVYARGPPPFSLADNDERRHHGQHLVGRNVLVDAVVLVGRGRGGNVLVEQVVEDFGEG